MKAFYVVLFVTLLIQLIPVEDDRAYLKRCIWSFAPLFLFLALREHFGNDYSAYEAFFRQVKTHPDNFWHINSHMESGYALLNHLFPSFRFLLIVMALLACGGYVYVFYKFIPPQYAWLGVLLLFFFGDKTVFLQVSGFRTAITVSMLTLSFPLIENRKIVHFFVVTALAMSIHTSSAFYLPLAFIIGTDSQIGRNNIYIWLILAVLCIFVSIGTALTPFMSIIDRFFGRYSDTIAGMAQNGIGIRQGALILVSYFSLVCFTLGFLANHEVTSRELRIFRIGLLMFFVAFLEAGSGRSASYYLPFMIPSFIQMLTTPWNNGILKIIFALLLFAVLYYAFFIVWMHNPHFSYDIYRSVIGNW